MSVTSQIKDPNSPLGAFLREHVNPLAVHRQVITETNNARTNPTL